jgi:hypothetical protein
MSKLNPKLPQHIQRIANLRISNDSKKQLIKKLVKNDDLFQKMDKHLDAMFKNQQPHQDTFNLIK